MSADSDSGPKTAGFPINGGVLLRLAVSATLLTWLFVSIDRVALARAFDAGLLGATLAAGLLVLLSALPAAERWRLLARRMDINLSRLEAIRATALSYFALQFAPSTLGADASRLASLRGIAGQWSHKTASVLVDRAYGVLSLLLLAPVSAVILAAVGSSLAAPVLILTLLCAAGLAAALLLSYWRPPKAWLRRRLVRIVARSVVTFRRACLDVRVAVPAMGLSLIVHALCMLAFWVVLCGAVGVSNARADAVLGSFPAASVVALAPVAINGWGVREASMVALLGAFQAPAPAALAASIAYGVSIAIAGGMGALVWAALPGRMTSLPPLLPRSFAFAFRAGRRGVVSDRAKPGGL